MTPQCAALETVRHLMAHEICKAIGMHYIKLIIYSELWSVYVKCIIPFEISYKESNKHVKIRDKAAIKYGLKDIKHKILWCELCATILANLITKTNEKIICVV